MNLPTSRTTTRKKYWPNPSALGFTLLELVVVMAMFALLTALLVPALAKSKPSNQAVQCRNNARQLTRAWTMYAADNNDALLGSYAYIQGRSNWVTGNLDFSSSPSNWDITRDLVKSPVWPYLSSNAATFKCPSDPSTVVVSGQRKPRVRSYCMSHVFGNGLWLPSSSWRTYAKSSQIVLPANTFVFVDVHPDGIYDGEFANTMAADRIVNFPSSFHYNGACSIALADGHSETHEWLGTRIKAPYRGNGSLALNVVSGDSASDMHWLAQQTTVSR